MSTSAFNIEREIICQFKTGNEFAFEQIFNKSKGKLKGFLLNTLPSDEDIESVLQDIYIKLWISRNFIDPDRNIEAFLFSIARNIVIDLMRKRLHKVKYLEEIYLQLKEDQVNNLDTLKMVEYSELEKKIVELIEKLPEKRKQIFKFNRINGLTYKEIAVKLNISENTVDTQIRKALEFLRIELKHFLFLLTWIYLNQ